MFLSRPWIDFLFISESKYFSKMISNLIFKKVSLSAGIAKYTVVNITSRRFQNFIAANTTYLQRSLVVTEVPCRSSKLVALMLTFRRKPTPVNWTICGAQFRHCPVAPTPYWRVLRGQERPCRYFALLLHGRSR